MPGFFILGLQYPVFKNPFFSPGEDYMRKKNAAQIQFQWNNGGMGMNPEIQSPYGNSRETGYKSQGCCGDPIHVYDLMQPQPYIHE